MWDSKNTNYFEGESRYTYERAKGHFYSIIRSQPHIIYSQCFLVAGIKYFTSFLRKGGSGI